MSGSHPRAPLVGNTDRDFESPFLHQQVVAFRFFGSLYQLA